MTISNMDRRSYELRIKFLRMIEYCRRGHIGPALSLFEIIRVLYDNILRYDPTNPGWKDRDRFILSKGHGCFALYIVLADKGFFPNEELFTACSFESRLGGHPEYGLPGIEASTGALGHGLSIGVGMAIAANIDQKEYQVFVLVGDGECQEGSIWEAALNAGKYGLDNLTVIVDRNNMQCYGTTYDVQDMESLSEKFNSFGFAVKECNGHDIYALTSTLSFLPFKVGKPSALICDTKKGMGFSSIINNPDWHHKSRITDEEIKFLYTDLGINK